MGYSREKRDRKYEEESVQNTLSLPTYTSSDAAEELEGKGAGKNTWRKRPRPLKVAMPEE